MEELQARVTAEQGEKAELINRSKMLVQTLKVCSWHGWHHPHWPFICARAALLMPCLVPAAQGGAPPAARAAGGARRRGGGRAVPRVCRQRHPHLPRGPHRHPDPGAGRPTGSAGKRQENAELQHTARRWPQLPIQCAAKEQVQGRAEPAPAQLVLMLRDRGARGG